MSTTDQNLARQMAAATDYHPDCIFADKASGKNFDRPEYQKMKSLLTAGDEVIVKSIDRLGRDKQGIKEELQWFKSNGILVRIIDIPTTMIAFPPGQEWIADMVTNIVVEVLSFIAQQERKIINNRRAEGIAAMPLVDGKRVSAKTGRGFGRPKCSVDMALLQKFYQQQQSGDRSIADCCSALGISRSTWYNLINQL